MHFQKHIQRSNILHVRTVTFTLLVSACSFRNTFREVTFFVWDWTVTLTLAVSACSFRNTFREVTFYMWDWTVTLTFAVSACSFRDTSELFTVSIVINILFMLRLLTYCRDNWLLFDWLIDWLTDSWLIDCMIDRFFLITLSVNPEWSLCVLWLITLSMNSWSRKYAVFWQ